MHWQTISCWALPYEVMLDRLLCCAIWHHIELFHAMLCHLMLWSTILHYAQLFHTSLIHFMLRCTIHDHNVLLEHQELVDSRFDCSTLQMKGELFALWLDCLTISCSTSMWVASLFVFWLDRFVLHFSYSSIESWTVCTLAVPLFNCLCYFVIDTWTISFLSVPFEIHVFLLVTAAHRYSCKHKLSNQATCCADTLLKFFFVQI